MFALGLVDLDTACLGRYPVQRTSYQPKEKAVQLRLYKNLTILFNFPQF
jgi:hypothetical protein